MIALSIRQPWAYFIIYQQKDVENRTWPCPKKYLGRRVLIHAGSSEEEKAPLFNALRPEFLECGLWGDAVEIGLERYWQTTYQLGGIIGSVRIVGCIRDSASEWAQPVHYHWLLADARPLPFFKCTGRLGFFEVAYPKEVPHGAASS